MSEPFYITTPIYYVNARPHLGHAYSTIVADVVCRYNLMRDRATFFLTGTDEHGDKIVRAAKNENLSPKVYVDKISGLFKDLCTELRIRYDHFIRTTDPAHIAVVKHILRKIYDSGEIYFSEYEGLYCFGCERFYTDRELVEGRCPDHKTEPEVIKESNYFFKMSRYQGWLIDHINNNPDFIRPERYRNEVLSFLSEPLEDLCISRPKTRLEWGISLPFDDNYVTYVWFDALINYISAIGYPDGELFKKFWPHVNHIVAKDILKPHGIYWPIMLKAAGIPVYKHLNVHGYWNVDQGKMSKSLGNVIEPLQIKNKYGLDAFRFFIMRDMVFGLDSSFSEESMVQRINSDLANDLGNLFSRVLAMAHKYFSGEIPEVDPVLEQELQLGLESNAIKTIDKFESAMENFEFHKALIAIWEFISRMNKYVDTTAPWELAKKKSSIKQLEAVIYNLLEGLRVISGLIYPVMPDTSAAMQKHLGMNPNENYYNLEILKKWGAIKSGTKLPKSVTLFTRVDLKKNVLYSRENASEQILPALKPEISLEEFNNIDLRIATVVHAEVIPRAKKLLKIEVDLGKKRTIVAGISECYAPEDIIGKQVIVVANLKPAKIMGILSKGMLLAAFDDNICAVGTVDKKIKSGNPLN
ncbi:MAG: methionine--tRNA ligase [Proteobacteria bacterium]|nr:methionine--tRNA ligase [Pseudomonadota bacterium]MBU4288834.1 methionine--tRNA ligase [Pseudomonadota bacterium]